MFVNCKHCNALVATDPATDLPPERCPRCAGVLRAAASVTPSEAPATADATPTISSLLLPPDPPARPATPESPAAAPAAGEASTTADVESVRGAVVAEPETAASVSALAPAEGGPVSPTPESPVDLAAEDGIANSDALPDAGVDGIPSSPPVEASPMPDVADGMDMHTPAPAPSGESEPDAATAGTEPASSTGDAEPESASVPAPAQAPEDDGRDAADATAAPSFLPARPRASRRWLPAVAIAALALLLGLQVLLADRARLAADAQWRPLVVSLCNAFGCEVPAWREPAAFTLLAREVRPHPQVPGALRVDAAFRNDARWPQPWPRLLLTLSDVEGRPVAARAFDADEYLAEPAAAVLDSGGTARIRIDLREPAAATVSYSFDFR